MRLSTDEYFMGFALHAAKRSTCLRRQVGAIVARDGKVVSTGYNGAPKGIPHCVTCIRNDKNIESGTRHETCWATHAEQNALLHAGYDRTNGSTLYSTVFPCVICTKMIVNAGIVRVVSIEGYPDAFSKEILSIAGVILS